MHILTVNPQLARIIGPYPKMVARRANNLKDLLVHSEFLKTSGIERPLKIMSIYPCGHCSICPLYREYERIKKCRRDKIL